MNKKKIIIIWTIFYVIIFAYLLKNSFSYLDPDLGWHLKIGEQILSEKSVPHLEYYNYPLAGEAWVDHEWAFNALIYLVYDKFGYIFLNIFFALQVVIILIILTVFIKKNFYSETKDQGLLGDFYIMLFQFFGVMAMAPHLGVRMQQLTLLNILLLLIILHQYNQNKNKKILFWLLPLFIVWTNFHGSFLVGFFIFGLFILTKIFESILNIKQIKVSFLIFGSYSIKNIISLLLFFVLIIFSTFLTPYGLKLYGLLKEYGNTFYLTYIMEWLPLFYYPFIYKQIIYLSVFLTFLIIIFYFNISKTEENKFKINFWYFILPLIFLILAFKSKRHFPLFFIASFPLMFLFCRHYLYLPKKIVSFIKNSLFIKIYLCLGSFFFLLGLASETNFTTVPFFNQRFCQGNPCQAVEFLKNQPEYADKNIFNLYGWGGYLLWNWPEKKIFIDGRFPQRDYNHHSFLEEYFEFLDEEKTENKLNLYDIELILWKKMKPSKLNRFEKYFMFLREEDFNQPDKFTEYLKNNNWEIAYEDHISYIFEKNQ